MRAFVKATKITIQMTKDQEKHVRLVLKCHNRPIQYAGAVMYSRCFGWYEIVAQRELYDWASDIQLMKGLLRKIRSILAPEVSYSEVPKPYVAEEFVKPQTVVYEPTRPKVDPSRLALLAKTVNARFGHSRN